MGDYAEFKPLLRALDADEGLNKDNIVDKIKAKLQAYPDEYKKWEEAGFDINHLLQ